MLKKDLVDRIAKLPPQQLAHVAVLCRALLIIHGEPELSVPPSVMSNALSRLAKSPTVPAPSGGRKLGKAFEALVSRAGDPGTGQLVVGNVPMARKKGKFDDLILTMVRDGPRGVLLRSGDIVAQVMNQRPGAIRPSIQSCLNRMVASRRLERSMGVYRVVR